MSTPLDERETAKYPGASQPRQAPGNGTRRPADRGMSLPVRLAAMFRQTRPAAGRFGGMPRPGSAGDPFTPTRQRLVASNVIAVALVLAVLGVVVYVFNVRSTQQEIDAQLAHYAASTAAMADEGNLPPPGSDQGPPGRIAPYSPSSPDLFTVVLAVLGVVVYVFNVRSTQQEIDAQLAHYATSTAAMADEGNLPPPGSNQESPGRIAPYSPSSPDLFTIVLDPSGKTLVDGDHIQQLGVPVVAAARPVLDGRQSLATTTVHAAGHDFRLYAIPAIHEGELVAVVVEGVSLDVQDQQQVNLLRTLALVFAVVLALTLLMSLYFTDRALRPARAAFSRQRQFAAAASHELRTPLAVIRSEAELATSLLGESLDTLRKSADSATTTSAVASAAALTSPLEESLGETRAITAEVDYMTRMANELLLLARDAADTRAHEWQQVDLHEVLRSVTDKIRPLAAREGLTLETLDADAAEPLWVRGDSDLLRQLVYGLLDNAVRYTPEGGSIRVAVRVEHHRRVTLTVSDTGVGIAPEHLKHIFEPFYRAISARPRREQQVGTGLGLALAEWIVRAHGGTIAVRSTVGEGTTFVVELPLAHGVPPDRPQPSARDADG